MVRSLAVLAFIAGVGGTAVYVAGRPTIAKGSVIAAELLESGLFGLLWGSEDHDEAVRAYFAKRPPRWRGR